MRNVIVAVSAISLIISVLSARAADVWLSGRIALFGSFAGLQYGLNPGIAWGIRLPPVLQEVLIGLALIAVAFLAKSAKTRLSAVSYGMILGGGAANIIDRLFDGYVTDYFQVGTFPIFNTADSFVSVGVALLLCEALRQHRAENRA